jgi:hypothetical protein
MSTDTGHDASADDDRKILCGTHGMVDRAFVCGHLFARAIGQTHEPLTYFIAEADESNEDEIEEECVWCAACDAVLRSAGDWTDEATAFADVHVVCEFCLAKILEQNVPGDPQD